MNAAVKEKYEYGRQLTYSPCTLCARMCRAARDSGGRGACRIHGGGFAGTLLAFVPNEALASFRANMEAVLGEGRCHVLSIRQAGGVRLA